MSIVLFFSIYVYIYFIRDNNSIYIIYSLVLVEYERSYKCCNDLFCLCNV